MDDMYLVDVTKVVRYYIAHDKLNQMFKAQV